MFFFSFLIDPLFSVVYESLSIVCEEPVMVNILITYT